MFTEKNLSPEDERLVQWDQRHVAHWAIGFGSNAGFLMDHSDGVSWYTSKGFEVMDGSSQLMCVNLGYREDYKREVAAAVAAQLEKLPFATNFWGFANETQIKAAEAVLELTPEGIEMISFTPGGGEAVEQALALSRWFWKNAGKHKFKIISLENSYHGMYFGAVSATKSSKGGFMNGMHPLVPGFITAPDYYCYRCPLEHTYPQCGIECARQIQKILDMEGADTVAAVICEVEHGTAGALPCPPEYLPMVREICDRNEVLLIVDEVMTGFGRTSEHGEAFACQLTGVTPDFLTMAKGINSAYLPLGALGMTQRIVDGLEGTPMNGPTYAGHVASCAAAVKVLEIYKRDGILQNAAEVGAYARQALEERIVGAVPAADHVSGHGLFLGIEIVKDPETKTGYSPDAMYRLQEQAMDHGLYVRISHQGFAPGNRIMFCPPLISTRNDIDRMVEKLHAALSGPSWMDV